MSFLKTRELPAGTGRSFSTQARRTQSANAGGSRGPVPGEYDSWWPDTEKALWIAICGSQAWSYEMYDRETQKVESLKDYLFYSYVHHFIAATKRKFVCSSGPHRALPCWGCGVRNAHYDRARVIQETTGARQDAKPPIGAMLQHAMSIVLLEEVAKVPVLDKDGKPRLSKEQKPILRDKPTCMLSLAERQKYKAKGVTTFGKAMHYSFGPTALGELLDMDQVLKNKCASCAGELMVFTATCPECQTSMQASPDEETPLTGEDLRQFRTTEYECGHCKYQGLMLPVPLCECGVPVEGTLLNFALRLRQVVTGEKTRKLELVEVKPITFFEEKYPVVTELLSKPLDLLKIFAPANLNYQKKLIPAHQLADGVSPEAKRTKGAVPAAEAYNFSSEDDEGDTSL